MSAKRLVTFRTASLSQVSTAIAAKEKNRTPAEMSDETLGILMDRLLVTAAHAESKPDASSWDRHVAEANRREAAKYRAELVARGYEIPDPEVEAC